MKLSSELECLAIEDKLQLVEDLWDSIDHNLIHVPKEQIIETEKRINRYKDSETTFHTWDEIKLELKNLK